MTATARFRPAPDLEQMLKDHPAVIRGVHDAAVVLHRAAVQRAEPHRDTGEYIERLVVEDRPGFGSAVVAGAAHSDFAEWGTSSRRSPDAPTPTSSPEKTGIRPQFILTGAIADVTR